MNLEFCSLASGSKGNSQFISTKNSSLLIDAGMSGKYIENALKSIDKKISEIKGILVTHEHTDHISGVGVLMRRYNFPLYITKNTFGEIKDKIGKIDMEKVNFIKKNEKFKINDLTIEPYEISHDAIEPLGFIINYRNKKISLATDLGHAPNKLIKKIKDCDLLFIESNHDESMLESGKYPYFLKRRVLSNHGHLSNDAAGSVIKEVIKHGRVKNILLAHLSKENNFPELAFQTVKNYMMEFDQNLVKDISLDMTFRKKNSKLFRL
ncbi:MAG: MBL fold metallo-hydrolase [Bacillota bacterium]